MDPRIIKTQAGDQALHLLINFALAVKKKKKKMDVVTFVLVYLCCLYLLLQPCLCCSLEK